MVDSDAETARKIEVRKLLGQIKTLKGCDGVILLQFSHTDETAKMMTYDCLGQVPTLDNLILAIATLVATEAYDCGKADAKKEAMESVLSLKPTVETVT